MSVLWDALNNIDNFAIVLLLLSLSIALFYEMINGFHDTANAVAMIIYTNSMKAGYSVIMAGIMNFIGVVLGGIGVAYVIVHLLPLDIMVSSNQNATLVMVFSLLISAVVWNLGTWYFGLPVSSSHSLIGSIVGVSIAFGMMNGFTFSQSVNWKVVYGILTALAVSPLLGFGFAFLIMKLSRKFVKNPKFFKTPTGDKKKKPNFWMRTGIIATGAGVSFAHGSNDGQKGIGLIMIILIGILPTYYALNMEAHQYKIMQTRDSAANLAKFYADNNDTLTKLLDEKRLISALKIENKIAECNVNQVYNTTLEISKKLDGLKSYSELSKEDRWKIHTAVLCSDNFFGQVEGAYKLIDKDKSDYIADQRKQMITSTEYVPFWVIFAVALMLGIGTMIGYKRVVHTIGEKIGSKPINHMQGTVSQAMAMITILLANFAHAPVSTTHIVSSAVAGTMVAEPDGGVQKKTINTILIAWIFTLPVTAIMGAAIYVALSYITKIA
ncbi:inorganic phosphate transporter [Aliarcobacter butzleri]|uniref:Phosphate transporter n=1 Tax=Aliarcobacter butzleri TaxID=28197 RepID=A0AAP4Q0T9_9BACT|nr:inorganic phosphate transporter [Aliarcobacter butzleri]AGR76850.1 phosphate transporter family protein [Aliarcobacter butzleri 7h1h]MBF7069765.1 inorganic phosphate transporter [Aliarcobacter butzleri]MCG3653120.1 inorganic phosphate transporter [Aliarcobacter butzleri]MCG3676710.1 inorganic phosphate transporter [Aliarcobacter butzleri]MCG3684480.1 inorganic phosphate transporter [Aliarcobacter butzleri]